MYGNLLFIGKRILLAMEAMLALMNPNPKGAKELPNIQYCYQILANFYMELDPGENQYYIDAVQEKAVTNPVIIRIKSMKKPTFVLGKLFSDLCHLVMISNAS